MAKEKEHRYGMLPESKKKYKAAIEKMTYSELFEEYEAHSWRHSGGYIDPISRDMLKIARKELIRRLEGKDKNFKAKKYGDARPAKSLFDL